MAGRHLKVELRAAAGARFDAIAFGRIEPLPSPARIAYRLMRDDYQGLASVRLVIEAVEPAVAAAHRA